MPSSVRVELDKAGFAWKDGVILAEQTRAKGALHVPAPVRLVPHDDALLDQPYTNGNASIDIPRVFARDAKAVYVPYAGRYGARIMRVCIHPDQYLKNKEVLPYPGDD